jgi:hypothetical protein
MYKIQSVNRINKQLLVKNPDAKEQIISNMLVDFAHEMFKNKCFEITETNVKGEVNWMQPDEQEVKIEALVMTPKEFKEAVETFKLIKCYTDIPESLRGYLIHLHTLLTKQPL